MEERAGGTGVLLLHAYARERQQEARAAQAALYAYAVIHIKIFNIYNKHTCITQLFYIFFLLVLATPSLKNEVYI